jgi:chitodextrinase
VHLYRSKRSTRDVLFRPAQGAKVVVRGSLSVYGRHLDFRRFTVTGAWRAYSSARDLTFRSVATGSFLVAGASALRVYGGSAGPAVDVSNVIQAGPRVPTSILIDGLTATGFGRGAAGREVSCLEVRAVNGLTIRRSRFSNCEDHALRFVRGGSLPSPTNLVVENNVLLCCGSGDDALSFEGGNRELWEALLVRNNSSTGRISISPASLVRSDVRVLANVASGFTGCRAPMRVGFNVWTTGAACGGSDDIAASGFTSPGAGNLELLPGAAAIDHGDPASYPSTDVLGDARPLGGLPDAGAHESPTSGLVAQYSFDEQGGTMAGDGSSLGNSGVVSGASWASGGRFGGALTFDGVNDWVTIPDAPSLDLTFGMTLEAWVRPSALGTTWRTVLIKEQPGDLAYALYANTDSRAASGHVFVGGDKSARGSSPLPLGQWSHVATTYDGSVLRLYVNGEQVSSRAIGGNVALSGGPLRIGGNAVWNEWFQGQIDDVRVYRRSLSAAELKTYKDRRVPQQSDEQPPTAPSALLAGSATQTSVTLTWTPATDNVAVAGYALFRSGTQVATSPGTAYTFSGLTCGTSYALGVEALDAAGNRSPRAILAAATSGCPPADLQAPSVPGSLTQSSATTTSITVAWDASADDTGVTGYGVYRDGSEVGSTAQTSYTFGGLGCGVSYTLAADAFDAAGNRSARSSVGAATSACPPPGNARVYLATNGSDGNACTRAAPCLSFNRAYHVAQPGEVVEVAGGTYGDQDVRYDATKVSATDVVFQPAAGSSVSINGDLVLGPTRFTRGASHVTFRDMTLTGDVQVVGCGASSDAVQCQPSSSAGGDDVTFQRLIVRGPYAFYCASCSNVSILGGTWGPATYQCRSGFGSAHPEVQNAYQKLKRSRGILIEGATFQNFARCASSDHTECMQMEPADDVTIRGSTFRKCDTIVVNFANDLAFDSKSAAGYEAPNNILIENNFFDESADNSGGPTWYALNIRECTNCTVRYNSWLQAPRMPTGQISLNNRFVGNVGPMGQANCGITGVTYSYNVWSDASCSATDLKTSNLGFVDATPGAFDLHLKATSAAVDRGDPSNYPASDIDGESRPLGASPDAGADERQ